jgi:hypothetical protein
MIRVSISSSLVNSPCHDDQKLFSHSYIHVLYKEISKKYHSRSAALSALPHNKKY